MKQIVKGIGAFNVHSLVHRDLKLDNIFVHFENETEINNEFK